METNKRKYRVGNAKERSRDKETGEKKRERRGGRIARKGKRKREKLKRLRKYNKNPFECKDAMKDR